MSTNNVLKHGPIQRSRYKARPGVRVGRPAPLAYAEGPHDDQGQIGPGDPAAVTNVVAADTQVTHPRFELLQRHPDIAAAKRHAAKAHQRIGIARVTFFTDLFPRSLR